MNLQLLALRTLTNPDGSTRREADVLHDIVYRDGSRIVDAKETLISGGSAGTPGCSASQTGSGWRFFGNQRLVGFSLQARITREQRYAVANGAPLGPLVRYRRDVRVAVSDPLGQASCVVITGPGPGITINGQVSPWSWKMVSPRIMRSAPEMAGKASNYTNWLDDDNFRYCGVAGTDTPDSTQADCLTYGAPGDNWGWGFTATPTAAADAGFAAQGWRSGGVYRLDVYNDDGWKRVNGHAARQPIATYYETLAALPPTFVEMAGIGLLADRFARFNLDSAAAAAVAANAKLAKPATILLSWTALPQPADDTAYRLQQTWEYLEGTKAGVPAGSSWPRLRVLERQYPGADAVSIGAWPVMVLPLELPSRTYYEYMLWYSDRNQRVIQSRLTFG